MDSGSFPVFNTGNRKNFLNKAKKKKQATTAFYASNQEVLKIQKNIRRFVQLVKTKRGSNNHIKLLLYMNKSEVFERPSLIWRNMVEKQSLLITKKMNIMAIQYCRQRMLENSQIKSKSQRSDIMRSFNEEKEISNFQSQDYKNVTKLMEVLCQETYKFSSYCTVLSKKQRFFWISHVYLYSNILQSQRIPQFSLKEEEQIRNFILSDPLKYLQIFKTNKVNPRIVLQLTKIICNEKSPQINFEQLVEHSNETFSYENLYENFKRYFWKHSLQQLQLGHPKFIILVLNHLIKTLSKNCFNEIMQTYKIEKYLIVSEPQATQEIVKQKLQWLSFLDFLNISVQSPLLTSLINFFIYSKSYEESMNVVNLIITIFETLGTNITQTFNITFEHFQIILQKIANWISIHQIQTNYDHQKMLLPYLSFIQNKLFNMWDRDFIEFFKGNQLYLEKIIKNSLIKIIYKIIFLKKPTKIIDKIFIISVRLLQNLYNKIFRTGLISTEAFVNQILSGKLRTYKFGNSLDEVSEFIQKFPFIFPLMLRLYKFRQFVNQSRYHNWNDEEGEGYHGGGKIAIRRGRQFQDAFNALSRRSLRKNLSIQFINEHGMKERGIDAGGLTKQFINRVLKAIFSKQCGMFIENAEHQLLPHPQRAEDEVGIISQQYRFIGKMIGKALYEGITIGPKFSGPFLNALIGKKNNFEDLRKIDKDLYNSLLYIRNMEENAQDLYLTFQFKDQITQRLVNLKYNGHKIKVTNENKQQYIALLAHYKVNKLLEYQSRHIRKGLSQMINKQWLYMFNYQQLNYLISGSGEINVDQLRKYTVYQGYTGKEQVITIFWKVVKEFNQENRSNLLMFVTSCPRPSFLGFKDLSPPFTIVKKNQIDSLPVSHTCSNVLQLPEYKTQQILRKKLLMAINSESGFEIA